MRRRLPSLHGLRAFEAAARHLSFVKAADELLLTPGAVSHHVRGLEAELGRTLFVRETRALRLTEPGAALLADAGPALDLLAEGAAAARRPDRTVVRVSLLSSFAVNWLLARLPGWEAANPGIDLILEPSTGHASFAPGGPDLAIRYGAGSWAGVRACLLLRERLAPVCSPALLRYGPALAQPADLADHTVLLSFAREPFEWLAWSESTGAPWNSHRTRMLHDYNIVLGAASAGQGVAMGRRTLIADRLARGELVEPCGPARPLGGIGHWIVTPPTRLRPEAAAFAGWLRREAAAGEPD